MILEKNDLTNFLAIEDHFWNKNVFAQNNFCMMTGVMGVTGVTWASKIEGGGGEEGGEAKGSKYFEKKCLVS